MKKIIIISPSGNLYGSEQVLFDYLVHTSKFSYTFVPKNSIFASTLKKKKSSLNATYTGNILESKQKMQEINHKTVYL
jgi:hypothetical protein